MACDGVHDVLRVGGCAPHGLVGVPKARQILENEDEVVGVIVEGGEVGPGRRQRIGEPEFLVEAHFVQVELKRLADRGARMLIQSRKLQDHRFGAA